MKHLKTRAVIALLSLFVFQARAQEFHVGAGASASMYLYNLSTFDSTGPLLDNIRMNRLGPGLTGCAGINFDLGVSGVFSIVTYPNFGFARDSDQGTTHFIFETPIMAEAFYGMRGDGGGGFIGAGFTYSTIAGHKSSYSSVFTNDIFVFSPSIIGTQFELGFQMGATIYKFNYTYNFKKPFSGVSNTSEKNINRGTMLGFTMIYQFVL